jgi:hypothetical protein
MGGPEFKPQYHKESCMNATSLSKYLALFSPLFCDDVIIGLL